MKLIEVNVKKKTKSGIKNKNIKTYKDLKKKFKKVFQTGVFVSILLLISIESYLWYLESNGYLVEPYEYGNRMDISYKINECYNLFNKNENKDKIKVIIIGDSRAETGFDPALLDFFFDKKTISYNLAIFDSAVRFQSLIIKKVIIPKLKPDIIIWEPTVPQDFTDDKLVYGPDERKLETPMGRYYTNNTKHLDFEDLCKYYLFKYSRLYRYRSNLRPNILSINENDNAKIESYKELFDRGFIGFDESLEPENRNFTQESIDFKLDEEAKDIFFDTIEFIEKNTDYYLILNGPNRYTKFISPVLDSIFNNFPQKNFLDLDGETTFLYDYLWMDSNHLNNNGALLFTEYIYTKINRNFKIN